MGWHCPAIVFLQIRYLRFSPWSVHLCSNWSGKSATKFLSWVSSKAVQMSASVYWFNGSRFILREPENKTGSWAQRQYKQLLKWTIKTSSLVFPDRCKSVANATLYGRLAWHRGYFQLWNFWLSLLSQNLYKPFLGVKDLQHCWSILEINFIPGEWQLSWF